MSWKSTLYGRCCLCLLLSGPGEAQTLFTEVTSQAFLGTPFRARAIAFGDYDNDNWPDLFLAEVPVPIPRVALWHNEGNGQFADQTMAIQREMPPQWKGSGAIFGDYDNDGDLDLFVPIGAAGQFGAGAAGFDILLHNDRGKFRDVALEAGLTDSLSTDNAIWLDHDRDGYLDLYMGNLACNPPDPTARNKLYRNRGNGTFVEVTQEAGLDVQLSQFVIETLDCAGGSLGGMAAGDFNDDGWPDLYLGVFEDRNRLFLNDGQGGFRDATTREIGDPGTAFGTAVGDIDNDGDLDLFQTSGGGGGLYRALMLLNVGEGQFLDVTEGVGVGFAELRNSTIAGALLKDLDNDGDLDLLTGAPCFLFLNDGNGLFTDQTALSGIRHTGWSLSMGDYDQDGFVDVFLGGGIPPVGGTLYRNNGNGNHYLKVELVGTQSNRSAIGGRLFATSGALRQMREILGGLGHYQDELVAHFGLGTHTKVDRLEIRWPSGQVEVLTDIPADQKIRVIEGRAGYHPVRPTAWEEEPPGVVAIGTTVDFSLAIRPALFEPGATVTQISADLSELGGAAEVSLVAAEDGTYRLAPPAVTIEGPNGLRHISVQVDQNTSLGSHWTRLLRQVTVVPGGDLVVFDETLAQGWQAEGNNRIKGLDLNAAGVVYQGRLAGAFEGESAFSPWTVSFKPSVPVNPVGYTALHFAFRPGELILRDPTRFTTALVPGKAVSLLDSGWVGLEKEVWQVVEIPVEAFDRTGPIEAISISGNFAGTFYLDDIRLVAATPPPPTVVEEDHTTSLPQSFSLSQNFPNPFNSGTIIRFALPQSEEVELVVFNLAGQKVATLVQGQREAGNYTVRWDGRDGQGHGLASGVYVYRLQAREQMETRKLLLLR